MLYIMMSELIFSDNIRRQLYLKDEISNWDLSLNSIFDSLLKSIVKKWYSLEIYFPFSAQNPP